MTSQSEHEELCSSSLENDEKLEILLARDEKLDVGVLPATVSDIFRHMIFSAIEDVFQCQSSSFGSPPSVSSRACRPPFFPDFQSSQTHEAVHS
ncbi:hypothetical protein TGRUB_221220C [Toxoplasma gondii RUB]|uniref:Uncharacterized protein n=2 Tax=Toxoplasma gondii TaxID=5811 RepID=A0A086LWM7_TOXGO|nr:hypothetical protein TGRUB_221220C [Toxoplasma gondii RUB]KFH14459.1 hypothetical protein TGMAS_221220C [Toxoplasma gondii MAS]